jgi:hypothetical protein
LPCCWTCGPWAQHWQHLAATLPAPAS